MTRVNSGLKKLYYVNIKNKKNGKEDVFLFNTHSPWYAIVAAIFFLYDVACIKVNLPEMLLQGSGEQIELYIDTSIGLLPSFINFDYLKQ